MYNTRWLVWAAALCVLALLALPAIAADEAEPAEPDQGPGIRIIAPEDGCVATAGEKLTIMLVLQGDLKPSTIAVMVDSRGIGMLQAPPYQLEWDTTGLSAGEHVLRAFAYTESGERIGARPVVVNLTGAVPVSEPASAEPQAAAAVLKEGTPILLQTVETMTSGKTPEGATVRLKAARDITGPGGCILVEYGAMAHGRVTRSRGRGWFGKAGQLEFSIDSVEAADGTQVPLRAQEASAGKSNRGIVVASALVLTVFAIFVHGQDITVPEGTELTAYVDHVTEIGTPLPARPGGEVRGAPVEEASIAKPASGQVVLAGAEVQVEISATPEQKVALVKLYLDGKEVAAQKGAVKVIKWSARGVESGQHKLEAEVQFASGRIVRTAPVPIAVSRPL